MKKHSTPAAKGLSVIKQNPDKQDTSFDQSIDRTHSLQLNSLSNHNNNSQQTVTNERKSSYIKKQMKRQSGNDYIHNCDDLDNRVGKVLLSEAYITDLQILTQQIEASKKAVLNNMRKKGYSQQKINHINTVLDKANQQALNRFIDNSKFIPDNNFTQQEKIPALVQLKLDKSVYKMNQNRFDILERGLERYDNQNFKSNLLNIRPNEQPGKELMILTNTNGYVLESDYINNIPLGLLQKQEEIIKQLELEVIEKTKRLQQIKAFRDQSIGSINKKCKLNKKWEGGIKYADRE